MPPRPRPQTPTLVCTRCHVEKPAKEYRPRKRQCKACESAMTMERYVTNRMARLAYAKDRQAALRAQHEAGTLPIADGKEMVLCPHCTTIKSIREFGTNHTTTTGLQPYCKSCMAQAAKDTYWKHRDQYVEKMRQDYADNPAKGIAYTREWQKAHPDEMRTTWATRRARKREAFIEKVEYAVLYERDNGICQIQLEGCRIVITKSEGTIDHVIPLALGGKHSYANTQLACRRCNFKKGSKILKQ